MDAGIREWREQGWNYLLTKLKAVFGFLSSKYGIMLVIASSGLAIAIYVFYFHKA